MKLNKKSYQLIRVACSNLQAESVTIDDNSITIDLDPDRPFMEMDEEVLEDIIRKLKLDATWVFRSYGYHYYFREEAFK